MKKPVDGKAKGDWGAGLVQGTPLDWLMTKRGGTCPVGGLASGFRSRLPEPIRFELVSARFERKMDSCGQVPVRRLA